MNSKTEANLAKLSEFEHRIAGGEEDTFYAFDEWLTNLPEDEVAALRLDPYDEPVKTPDEAWVERCWHEGCLSALIAPPAPLPDGLDPGRSSAAQAAAEAAGWIYTASGRMFCPAHVGDWGVMNRQEKDERCWDGCLALRMARAADQILQEESPDSWWEVQFWALSSSPGEIKLTPAGGYPHGTVPVEFRIKWWLAVSDAALEMVRYLRSRDHGNKEMNRVEGVATGAAQLGEIVLYAGRDGLTSPALVTITPETWDAERAGTDMTRPGPDEVSLVVWRASGRSYARHNVPREGSPAHAALLREANEVSGEFAGESVRKVRCWRFRS